MWERLAPLIFPVSFLNNPEAGNDKHRKSDEDLARKFKMHVNQERMFNWISRCCQYYVQNQDKPFPKEIKDEILKYKQECNMLVEFIEDNKDRYSIELNTEVDLKQFMETVKSWCKERSINLPNNKKIEGMLKHINCDVNRGRRTIVGLRSNQQQYQYQIVGNDIQMINGGGGNDVLN